MKASQAVVATGLAICVCQIVLGQAMVPIPGGEFEMGCHAETGETCFSFELPVHDVYVAPFCMDMYAVTNEQYCTYLNSAYGQGLIEVADGVVYKAGDAEPYCYTTTSSPYSRITWDGSTFGIAAGKEHHPMVEVSWYGAVAYCNWRSEQHERTPCYDLSTWTCDFGANGYRLPSEAEWEYAARGAEHDPYYAYPWGNTIDGSEANYWESDDPYETGAYPWTTPVGYYDGGQTPAGADMANGFGLYDMAGNVWEWCHDWYDPDYYDSSPYDNPTGPTTGTLRVSRGGSWYHHGGSHLRCANRVRFTPDSREHFSGFRVAAGTATCMATAARSLRNHAGVGELSLDMGVSGGVEPRQGGIQKLEIDLEASGGASFSGGVTIDCSTAWSGNASGVAAGDTVTVTFDTPLPDRSYCTVTLDCGAQVCVRGLEGDIDRGGLVSTGDASIIKPNFGDIPSEASANVEFDFDCSGLISTGDFSQVKPKFGNAAPECP